MISQADHVIGKKAMSGSRSLKMMSKRSVRRNMVMLSTLPLIQTPKVTSTSSLIVYREVKTPSKVSTEGSLVVVRSARNRLSMLSTAVFSLKLSRARPQDRIEVTVCYGVGNTYRASHALAQQPRYNLQIMGQRCSKAVQFTVSDFKWQAFHFKW